MDSQNKLDELRKFINFLDDGLKKKEAVIFKNKIDNLHRICGMLMNRIVEEIQEIKENDIDSDDEDIYNEYKDDEGDVDSVSDYDIEYDIDLDDLRDSDSNDDDVDDDISLKNKKQKIEEKKNYNIKITEQFKNNCKEVYGVILKSMPFEFTTKQIIEV